MSIFKSKIERAKENLKELGAQRLRHTKQGTLHDHLARVEEIVARWSCDEDTRLAALYHSAYSTKYFEQEILDIRDRAYLQKEIGEAAERMVYTFSLLERDALAYDHKKGLFTFTTYADHAELLCDHATGVAVLHILLANDMDHIGVIGVGSQISNYKKYEGVRDHFNEKAKSELEKIIQFDEAKTDKVFIRFIAHSGVQIASKEVSVVVDPWLYDSRKEMPIIESIDPTQSSIDYLIPEPRNTARELSPDIVCLSHFHTHHSPLQEIIAFAKIKNITIVCPPLDTNKLQVLKQKIGAYIFDRISFVFVSEDKEIQMKGVTVRALLHRTQFPHLMFHITVGNKSIMHIVDAKSDGENPQNLQFSEDWKRIYDSRPDFLFIGAVGHISKEIKNGHRYLKEADTLTPAQAALLASRIMPKNVGVIGMYNHSVWDDRYEMGLSVGEAEAQFYWCLSYIAPAINVEKLLPGKVFNQPPR